MTSNARSPEGAYRQCGRPETGRPTHLIPSVPATLGHGRHGRLSSPMARGGGPGRGDTDARAAGRGGDGLRCLDQPQVAEGLGKLPTWRWRSTSYSSARRPTSLRRESKRSNSTRASSTRPLAASALTSQNEQARTGLRRRAARRRSPWSSSGRRPVAGELGADRVDRAGDAVVVSRQEPHERDRQRAGVELRRVVGLGERVARGVIAAIADLPWIASRVAVQRATGDSRPKRSASLMARSNTTHAMTLE